MRSFLVVMRADGCPGLGLGQLALSLTVADQLSGLKGIRVKFVINNRMRRFFSRFSNQRPYVLKNADRGRAEGVELVGFLKKHRADLLLSAPRGLGKRVHAALRRDIPTVPVVAIDDLASRGVRRLAQAVLGLLKKYHCDSHTISQVRNEYGRSARRPEEHAKAKWGSPEGMVNRFHLGIRVIEWDRVDSWLDVGSGTGAFLAELERTGAVGRFRGIDLSPAMVRFARRRTYRTGEARFDCQNFLDAVPGAPYDLVTCIGVLQKCAIPLEKAVARLAELVKPGGQVFVTTKNLDWERFRAPAFMPEKGHNWFRLDRIRKAFASAGLTILDLQGFEPRERGRTCAARKSHSVYVLAEKRRHI